MTEEKDQLANLNLSIAITLRILSQPSRMYFENFILFDHSDEFLTYRRTTFTFRLKRDQYLISMILSHTYSFGGCFRGKKLYSFGDQSKLSYKLL